VVGCGPVGLAVICHLKARGVRTIVASDLSAKRRALATRCGADVVVDPTVDSPYQAASTKGVITTAPALYELGIGSMEKLRRLPGWSHVYRAAEALGAAGPKRPVIFECVGVPGIIDGVIGAAPLSSRVVVVGVCMGQDKIRPALANGKEIDLRFVFGYTPLEFRDTLYMLAEGKLDAAPLITGPSGSTASPPRSTRWQAPRATPRSSSIRRAQPWCHDGWPVTTACRHRPPAGLLRRR
jgi:threonine dehydrogenase-like Zn-dependent dehydrogenase